MGYFKYNKDCSETLKSLQDSKILAINSHNHKTSNTNEHLILNFFKVFKSRASKEKNELLKNVYYEEIRRNIDTTTLYSLSTVESVMYYSKQNSMTVQFEDRLLIFWLKNIGKIELTISHPSLWKTLGHLTNSSHNYPIDEQLHDNLRSTDPGPILPTDPVSNDVPIDEYSISLVVLDAMNLQNTIILIKDRDIIEKLILDKEPTIPIRRVIEIPNTAQIDNMNVCMSCVCESDEKYIVFPCGHAWLCIVCVRQLLRDVPICPTCQIRNVFYQRINFF